VLAELHPCCLALQDVHGEADGVERPCGQLCGPAVRIGPKSGYDAGVTL
jgi:hypothetical protein